MPNQEMFSLSSCDFELYTNEIAEWLVPGIVSERTLSRIREVLFALPGKTTNALGLEFLSDKSEYDCDISLSIDPFVDKNELVAWRTDEFNKNCKNSELISDIKVIPEIVKVWEDKQTRLSEVIKELFLEIDTRASTANNIPLNIFLTLLQNNDPGKISEIIIANLVSKLERTPQSNLIKCLEQIAKLPKNLFITHLGFMVGRPSKAIRVLVRCKTGDLCNELRNLGLNPKSYIFFLNFLKIVKPRCSYVVLAININQYGIETNIAIECGLIEAAKPDAYEWWLDFIQAIGTLGNFDNQVSTMKHIETLKKSHNEMLNLHDKSNNRIEWGLNHIKVGFSQEKTPTIKWYIGMYGVKTCILHEMANS